MMKEMCSHCKWEENVTVNWLLARPRRYFDSLKITSKNKDKKSNTFFRKDRVSKITYKSIKDVYDFIIYFRKWKFVIKDP